ncbi:MAG: glycerol-3-phosphate dehydrogenase/oxidase [Spirochaetes bacterium]|nr:glycerol-3-phosphate dehydrogenase/oxidase [Spirochaetota bacterium]
MKRFIDTHRDEQFDLIVIGGGITGAAVAYDAAGRGLSVALLEKSDFGCATSAATSKFIHGGLRYLKTYEFGLVRESLRERRIMENIAPNFVYPLPCMFTSPSAVIKLGLYLYDILAFDKGFTWDRKKRIPNHYTVSRERVIQEEPNVKRDGLTGAGIYYDCISICPERLTLAFIKSAERWGARVANYARVENFIMTGGTVSGVVVRDLIKEKMHSLRGACTVNCAGPWADEVLGLANRGDSGLAIKRSEGIHLIIDSRVNSYAVGTMTKNQHFFLIPWRGHTLIGTTDKEYPGSPDEYRVARESIEELLDLVNAHFGNDGPIRYKDVRYTYGGLRPLVGSDGGDSYTSTRKYEVIDHAAEGLSGLITAEGGKYTTSRNLAAQVLRAVEKRLGRKPGKCTTASRRLAGCEIDDVEAFIERIKGENPDFDPVTMEYLGRHYGTDYGGVMALAMKDKKLRAPLNADGEILAQVVYAIERELAFTLRDILFRRTGIGTLGHPGKKVLAAVADLAAKKLKWSPSRKAKEIRDAEEAFRLPK